MGDVLIRYGRLRAYNIRMKEASGLLVLSEEGGSSTIGWGMSTGKTRIPTHFISTTIEGADNPRGVRRERSAISVQRNTHHHCNKTSLTGERQREADSINKHIELGNCCGICPLAGEKNEDLGYWIEGEQTGRGRPSKPPVRGKVRRGSNWGTKRGGEKVRREMGGGTGKLKSGGGRPSRHCLRNFPPYVNQNQRPGWGSSRQVTQGKRGGSIDNGCA